MHAVFLDKQTFSSSITLVSIEQHVTKLSCYNTSHTEDVLARCIDADIILTNKVVLNAELLSALPKLKLICITATGYNNVDLAAAKKHNIAVTNVSGYAGSSVAQYVFAQLLEYYQKTTHHNANTEQGLWSDCDTFCYQGDSISELAGKTLGIVGYGSLGQAVANIARAFSMRVLISERPNTRKIRPERVSFEQVIQEADVLTLHCPQTPETEKLINADVLSKMKSSAVLVNTARGALVDELALLEALKTKDIAYAILDVLSQEPPPADHPLLSINLDTQLNKELNPDQKAQENNKLSHLKVTAHIAWASKEAQQRLIELVAKNIADFTLGKNTNRLDS